VYLDQTNECREIVVVQNEAIISSYDGRNFIDPIYNDVKCGKQNKRAIP